MDEKQELLKDVVRELLRLENVFHEANSHVPKADRDLIIISAMLFESINYAMGTAKMPAKELVKKMVTSMIIHEAMNK
jgi:hypothetical protein